MSGLSPRTAPQARVRLSSRTGHLREASLLRSLTQRVSAFPDGINLGQGVCDLEMPDVLRAAAIRSLREDRATYTPFGGLETLRAEIAKRMRRRYDVAYELDEIVVTIGASAALFSTYLTLVDPGDEVVLLEPFYPYHYTGALLAGARVVAIATEPGTGAIDWDALAAAIGPRTRLVVVNTPSNPLGRVWTASELDRLADLLDATDAVVMSDEIYEDLVYDGKEHVPPAARPGLYERTVTVSGLSKAYSITGWRLGWLAAPRALSSAIGPVFDVLCVCAPRPLQAAAATALAELPESYYRSARDAYAQRRDRLAAALRAGGLAPWVPSGAYYMMADYRDRYGAIPTRDACFRLLDEIHVATIPGEIFHAEESPPVVRFHFAVEDEILAEVERRLRRGRA
jgi:aminotransferase